MNYTTASNPKYLLITWMIGCSMLSANLWTTPNWSEQLIYWGAGLLFSKTSTGWKKWLAWTSWSSAKTNTRFWAWDGITQHNNPAWYELIRRQLCKNKINKERRKKIYIYTVNGQVEHEPAFCQPRPEQWCSLLVERSNSPTFGIWHLWDHIWTVASSSGSLTGRRNNKSEGPARGCMHCIKGEVERFFFFQPCDK